MSIVNPIRFGVIGCGVIGKKHIEEAVHIPEAEVTAICDLQETLVKEVADEHSVPFFTTEPGQLIARDDVDVVLLALPAAYRFDLGIQTLENGKHLLLEKPAAMNAGQLQAYEQKRGDRQVASCSCRYSQSPTALAARRAIKAGLIGGLRKIHCRALVPGGPPPNMPPPTWRLQRAVNGGGIFVNWGCYDLDFLFSILDWNLGKLNSVCANTWTMPPDFQAHQSEGSDAETHITLLAQYKEGPWLQYERAERATTREENSWQIIGDRGTLHLNMLDLLAPIELDRADSKSGLVSEIYFQPEDTGYNVHAIPMQDFAQALLENRRPQTDLQRCHILQELVDAAYQSADDNRKG